MLNLNQQFGKKIQTIVPNNSRIMYGLTVQDAWCVTKREIIMDPTFNQTYDPSRAKEEMEYYNVDYLLLDLSNKIYKRNQHKLSKVLKFYDGKISMKHAINLSKRDTRRYIKRQSSRIPHGLYYCSNFRRVWCDISFIYTYIIFIYWI